MSVVEACDLIICYAVEEVVTQTGGMLEAAPASPSPANTLPPRTTPLHHFDYAFRLQHR